MAERDPLENVADAVDTAIDELTGVPTDDGDIERFTASGMTLLAEARGAEDAPVTFVLLHGIGMGRKVFADLARRLKPHGRVIAIDQPGYGEAPEPPRTPTIERSADLVGAYLRKIDRGRVVLIGHSMGTQVAVEVAVRHPSTVGRLVLVAPTVDRHHRRARTQLLRLAVDLLDESPKVLLLGAREYVRAGPHLRRKMRAMMTHRPEDSYPRVAAPTLVIRGAGDRVCTAPWSDEVTRAIPGARAVQIPGHGHETLIRDAEPATEAILTFLRDA